MSTILFDLSDNIYLNELIKIFTLKKKYCRRNDFHIRHLKVFFIRIILIIENAYLNKVLKGRKFYFCKKNTGSNYNREHTYIK